MGFDLDLGSLSCQYQGPHSYILSVMSSAYLSLKSLWVLSAKNWHRHQLGSLLKVKCYFKSYWKKAFRVTTFVFILHLFKHPRLEFLTRYSVRPFPASWFLVWLASFSMIVYVSQPTSFFVPLEYQFKVTDFAMCSSLLLLLFAARHSRVGLHCTVSLQTPDTTESTKTSLSPMTYCNHIIGIVCLGIKLLGH